VFHIIFSILSVMSRKIFPHVFATSLKTHLAAYSELICEQSVRVIRP